MSISLSARVYHIRVNKTFLSLIQYLTCFWYIWYTRQNLSFSYSIFNMFLVYLVYNLSFSYSILNMFLVYLVYNLCFSYSILNMFLVYLVYKIQWFTFRFMVFNATFNYISGGGLCFFCFVQTIFFGQHKS